MKKLSLFLFAVMISTALFAQNIIPDGSFENGWYKPANTVHNYDEYSSDLFYTLNELSEEPEVDVVTAYKSTDAQSGQYAVKLVSRQVPGFILIPGAMGTISHDFIGEYLDNYSLDARKDFVFTAQPQALQGYFKYVPVNGDSAAIEVGIYKDDNLLATKKFVTNEWFDEWTPFSVPLNYEDTTIIPNKVKILLVASAAYDFDNLEECAGQDGSTLLIDNISFLYKEGSGVGITENLTNRLSTKAFPIPATDNVTISWGVERNLEIVVFNIAGAVVAKENVNGSAYIMNLSNMETGNYFYRLVDGNNIVGSGKFVKVGK